MQAETVTLKEYARRGTIHHHEISAYHHEISAFCFYIFTYMNKTYSNKLSMIDDDEDMPPLLSAMDFDDEAMEWNAMDFADDA